MPYLWAVTGSHPSTDEDDFWTLGDGFESLAAAREAGLAYIKRESDTYPLWLTLAPYEGEAAPVGPKWDLLPIAVAITCEVKGDPVKAAREERQYQAMCRNEGRMQAAMAFGVQGWNDYDY